MFNDFEESVITDYRDKCGKATLSVYLLNPSPANLKLECLSVFKERYNPVTDYQTLRDFFGPIDPAQDYFDVIKKFDVDKFKPLTNFINGNTNHTSPKNIKLLAWLINFKPSVNAKQLSNQEVNETGNDTGTIKKKKSLLGYLGKSIKNFGFSFSTVTVVLAGGYFTSKTNLIMPAKQCMYWTGDHYQPVSCEEKIYKTPIIALDTVMVAHFKKIKTPDTITLKSLGKLWYVKINNKPECFTSEGYHPVYTSKHLKPITGYIICKYFSCQADTVISE